jgi:hypothetical protein
MISRPATIRREPSGANGAYLRFHCVADAPLVTKIHHIAQLPRRHSEDENADLTGPR